MSTLSIQQAHKSANKLNASLRVAGYMAIALLAALLLGTLLSSGNWTLPTDPVIAASFTA